MIKSIKYCLIDIVCVIVTYLIAIAVHSIMPSSGGSMDIHAFDSILVNKFGFSIVASAYFLILYLHVLLVIKFFASKSILGARRTGWFYGMAFGLIYMGGMQEVILSSSPFTDYGIDFIRYQFFIGLGDAIPVIALCVFTCWLYKESISNHIPKIVINSRERVVTVGIISILFFIERTVGYSMGYVASDISIYPIPTLLWTFLFGIIIGFAYLLLISTFENNERIELKLLTAGGILGVNWIWFNCFIGLLFKNTIVLMLLRSSIDVVAVIAGAIISGFLLNNKGYKKNKNVTMRKQ